MGDDKALQVRVRPFFPFSLPLFPSSFGRRTSPSTLYRHFFNHVCSPHPVRPLGHVQAQESLFASLAKRWLGPAWTQTLLDLLQHLSASYGVVVVDGGGTTHTTSTHTHQSSPYHHHHQHPRDRPATFDDLPYDMLELIARELDSAPAAATYATLCTRTRDVMRTDEESWRRLTLRVFPFVDGSLEPSSWRTLFQGHHLVWVALARNRRPTLQTDQVGIWTLGTQVRVRV